jgi:hypothetical protein
LTFKRFKKDGPLINGILSSFNISFEKDFSYIESVFTPKHPDRNLLHLIKSFFKFYLEYNYSDNAINIREKNPFILKQNLLNTLIDE